MGDRKSGVGRRGLRDHTPSSITAEFSNTCALATWRPVTWETGEQELLSLEQRRAGMMGKGALVAVQGRLLGQKTTLIKHPPYSLPRPSPHYQPCYSHPKTPLIPGSNKSAVHAPGFLGPPSGAKASEHDQFFTGPFVFHVLKPCHFFPLPADAKATGVGGPCHGDGTLVSTAPSSKRGQPKNLSLRTPHICSVSQMILPLSSLPPRGTVLMQISQ